MLQGVGGDVPGQVVDAVQGHPGRVGHGLRPGQPHLEGPGQPGAGGDRDGVDLADPQPGPVQGLPDHRVEGVQVGAGGDLRHHPAEAGVLVHAGRDDVGEQPAVLHDARPGLVARRLDPQYHRSAHGAHSFCTYSTPAI